MGKKIVCFRASISAPSDNDFADQKLLIYNETCSFDDEDIGFLKFNGSFPIDTIFRPYDALIQPYFFVFLGYAFLNTHFLWV